MACLKVNAMAFASMVKMLLEEPCTVHEIVAETGLHTMTVSRYVRAMHKARAVYIAGWEKDRLGRDCTKVYGMAIGKKRDVPAAKMTASERMRLFRARKKERAMLRALAGQPQENRHE